MTRETLQKAKELEEQIDNLLEHLSQVKERQIMATNFDALRVCGNQFHTMLLLSEHLDINLPNIIQDYILNVNTKLNKLEKELEELK